MANFVVASQFFRVLNAVELLYCLRIHLYILIDIMFICFVLSLTNVNYSYIIWFYHYSCADACSLFRSVKKSDEDIPVPPLVKSAALWGMLLFPFIITFTWSEIQIFLQLQLAKCWFDVYRDMRQLKYSRAYFNIALLALC